MKKILQYFKKFDTPMVYGIICFIFGIGFLAFPIKILNIMLVIAGVFIAIISGMKILEIIDGGAGNPLFTFEIIKNAVILFFGILLSVTRSRFSITICSFLGIYLVFMSVTKLISSSRVPRELHNSAWWTDVILTIILLLLGIWLTTYPVWPKILAGITLVTVGIELVFKGIKTRKNSNSKNNDFYIDDFKDNSEE